MLIELLFEGWYVLKALETVKQVRAEYKMAAFTLLAAFALPTAKVDNPQTPPRTTRKTSLSLFLTSLKPSTAEPPSNEVLIQ